MSTAVVILNWNNRSYLERFLPVLLENTPRESADLIVVDNASTDDSIDWLTKNYPDIRLIRIAKNLGYAGGYNIALKGLPHDYFVCINSDVEVTPGWIQPLIRRMEEDPSIGACMPKIRALDDRKMFEYAGAAGGFLDCWGYSFCRGRLFNVNERDEGQYDTPSFVFWASGACLLVRAKAFRQAGGFDARFFAHMEEIDLCWRMQNADWSIFCETDSVVYHMGAGSLASENPLKTYLNFRNNLLMLYKNLKRTDLLMILPIRLILDGIAAGRFLIKGQIPHFLAIFKAHCSFYSLIPGMRKSSFPRKNYYLLKGVYKGSAVFDFFMNDIQRFSDLKGF